MDHHRTHNAVEASPGQWRHQHRHTHEPGEDWHHYPQPQLKGTYEDHEHPHWRPDTEGEQGDHHDLDPSRQRRFNPNHHNELGDDLKRAGQQLAHYRNEQS